VQHRTGKPDRSARSQSQRCVHITALSHARATRTLCIVSMLTVCLQCTTQQPLWDAAPTHSHRCAQTSLALHKKLAGVAYDSDFNMQYNTAASHCVRDALEATRTLARSDCRCCQGLYLACFESRCATPFCDDDNQHRRLNVREQGSLATVRATHTLRSPDALLPEHVTPAQPLSHGSLPVV
jgi:hypothetical protein